MSKPKVLIFAPREEPPETMQALEGLGCEVVVGSRDWQLPRMTICSLALTHDARYLAAGLSDGNVHVFRLYPKGS